MYCDSDTDWDNLLLFRRTSQTGLRRSEAAGNTMSSATQVSFGTTFYGRITEDNSKDWYRIDLPISGKLTIRLQAEIWRVYYHLYDSDTESYFSNYITWNETTKISNKTIEIELRAGTYYYLVERYYDANPFLFREGLASGPPWLS